MKSVAPFVRKLHQMLQQESIAPSPILSWAHHDTAFVIYDLDALEARVLPKYFDLIKYKSFQRQLHYFGFRKWTKTMASVCTYSHPHFQRHAMSLMTQIQRKRRFRGTRQKKKSIAPPTQELASSYTAPYYGTIEELHSPLPMGDPALYYDDYQEVIDWLVQDYSIN